MENITLIHGDSLMELPKLPSNSVDAIITDPPYCSGGQSSASRKAPPRSKYQGSGTMRTYTELLGDQRDQRGFVFWSRIWMAELFRIAKPNGLFLIFTDWRQLPSVSDVVQAAGWNWRRVVVWDKGPASRPNAGEFRSQAEFIIFATKGAFKPLPDIYLDGVLRFPVISNQKNHINAKPIPLIQELLKITPKRATILDPFLGGGAVARACVLTGRKCIGIELNEEAMETAKALVESGRILTQTEYPAPLFAQARLDRETRQGQLFPPAGPEQRSFAMSGLEP